MGKIEEGIQKLVEVLAIEKLPPSEQERILDELYQILQMRIGAHIAERLTEEQVKHLEKLGKTNERAAEAELVKLLPDYEQIVAQELDGMIADTSGIMKPPA